MLNFKNITKRKRKPTTINDILISKEELPSPEREELCDKLKKVESEAWETENIRLIENTLYWLWNQFELSEFGLATNVDLPPKAYSRQINRMLACFRFCSLGKTIEAYHEFCDFISNYHQNWYEPINGWEKICIKAMIERIFSTIEEDQDAPKNYGVRYFRISNNL